jgi:hypothetical protein
MDTRFVVAALTVLAALASPVAIAQDVNSPTSNRAMLPPGAPSAPGRITIERNAPDDVVMESAQLDARTTPTPPLPPARQEPNRLGRCPPGSRCDPAPNAVNPLPSGGGR